MERRVERGGLSTCSHYPAMSTSTIDSALINTARCYHGCFFFSGALRTHIDKISESGYSFAHFSGGTKPSVSGVVNIQR